MAGIQAQNTMTTARALQLKEGIAQLREEVIKKASIKRPIKINELCIKLKLPPMTCTHLRTVGAIVDYKEAVRGEGVFLDWVYTGSETGIVDQKLMDKFNETRLKYDREYRAQKNEVKVIDSAVIKETYKKMPSKGESLGTITTWIEEELAKNELVPGYIKARDVVMYTRIREVIEGLTPLKELINNLNL